MPEFMKQIDEQTADMTAVVILIGHDENGTVAKTRRVCVLLARHQTHNLLQLRNLLRLLHLGVRRVLHIQHLALERIHAKVLALFLRQTRQCHRLRRITLGQDQRALGRLCSARIHCIVQLRNARNARLFLAVRLAVVLRILGRLCLQDRLHHAQFRDHLLQRLLREFRTGPEGGHLRSQRLLGLRRETGVLDQTHDEHTQMIPH